MSRSRCFSTCSWLTTLVVVGVMSTNSALFAQLGGMGRGFGIAAQESSFASPVPFQVFQRDDNNRAEIPIVLNEKHKDKKIVSASVHIQAPGGQVFRGSNPGLAGSKFEDGKLVGVPVGGPYQIVCGYQEDNPSLQRGTETISNVYVGDLWVLAGQSNMEGVGDLVDVTPPNPWVQLLGMDGKWVNAEEPLHWLVDSPDPVHSGDPNTRAERSAQQHKTRTKGAGLGLPFAVAMVENTRVPVGLVAAAHGGTSMEQWNPAKKGEEGNSLYGSMLRQVKLAGGKVKGLLWYQGESDSSPEGSKIYAKVFTDFIAAVRADFGKPDLPFYLVQIGRFVQQGDPSGWNTVQEAERLIPDQVFNTAVVSVIDLELDDGIHVGTQGLKRVGQRLAKIALREQFGQVGASTPTFERVSRGPHNTLVVKFKGVNLSAGSPTEANRAGMTATARLQGQGTMAGPRGLNSGAPNVGSAASPIEGTGVGLTPERHIAGFSIRKQDGTFIPLIFDAAVGKARDTVILKLNGAVPPDSYLWYGYGYDPYCNLTDGADMAVPVFGPIALDEAKAPAVALTAAPAAAAAAAPQPQPVKLLIITGDHGHDWKATTPALKELLSQGGRIAVDVTTTPSKDLTAANLAKYDVLLLNYKDTANGSPESKWSDDNKKAFLDAVRGGKGLVVFHHASSAFTKPNWEEFEQATGGGWRSQGFHGPKLVFNVKKTETEHPISKGLPAQFEHKIDELYQNSLMVPGNVVLATAYSDPSKPKGTDKDEPVIWVNQFGQGRVYNNALGHDVEAISGSNFQDWMRRGVIWAATGNVD